MTKSAYGQAYNDNRDRRPMYAIAFDMKMDALRTFYSAKSPGNAYREIKNILAEYDFSPQQESVYFGDVNKVDAVRTVLAIIDVTKRLPWFSACVGDVRMLRIEDNNDLMPAVYSAAPAIPLTPLATSTPADAA